MKKTLLLILLISSCMFGSQSSDFQESEANTKLFLDIAPKGLKSIALGATVKFKDVEGIAISTDGKYIVRLSDDKKLEIWDGTSENPKRLIDTTYKVESIDKTAFSPDGKILIASNDTMLLIDLSELPNVVPTPIKIHKKKINSVVFSPSEKYMASCSDDGFTYLFENKQSSKCVPFDYKNKVTAIAISPCDNYFITGLDNGSVFLWDISNFPNCKNVSSAMSIPYTNVITHITFSQKGKLCLISYGKNNFNPAGTYIYDLSNHNSPIYLRIMYGHRDNINSVSFNSNNKYIFSESKDNVVIWDIANIKNPECIYRLIDNAYEINSAKFSIDNNYIFTTSSDKKTIRKWDIGSSWIFDGFDSTQKNFIVLLNSLMESNNEKHKDPRSKIAQPLNSMDFNPKFEAHLSKYFGLKILKKNYLHEDTTGIVEEYIGDNIVENSNDKQELKEEKKHNSSNSSNSSSSSSTTKEKSRCIVM